MMSIDNNNSGEDDANSPSKKSELGISLFLTFIIIPAVTIAAIGAYGFIVWFLQILNGPPGS
ncbi:periplasmic nitrate reductase, NapE protein [Bacterioplanoides sp.]|uniref:periplasmic nitrate reductase, NapE protein n=1 Tax=Bacterioplanoides sp. TaxID=2066072 RepID=UPI003AFFA683